MNMQIKKVISLTILGCFFVMPSVGFANESSKIEENYINDAKTILQNDPEFLKDVAENGDKRGQDLIESLAMSLQRNDMTSQEKLDQLLQQKAKTKMNSVPIIKQINSYYCGPCSALQALYGNGNANKVSGSSDAAKQTTLGNEMGTTSGTGTMVYKVVGSLNNYASVSSPKTGYKYLAGSSQTLDSLSANLSWGIIYDAPSILHAKTEYLNYYGGKAQNHYICVSDISSDYPVAYKTVTLADCNYSDAYRGYHSASIGEVFNSIAAASGRYLITV